MITILLIEDDENIRLNVSEILTLAKYKVIPASNGRDGINAALDRNPDLVISDIMMPAIDGFGVLHILRKNKGTKDTPFIFLTAKKENNDLRQAMNLGADDFIIKPFEGNELLNAVEKCIKRNNLDGNSITEPLAEITEAAGFKDPLSQLIETCDIMEYKSRHIIYKEGSMPRYLYFIKSGRVKTYKSHADGKDLVVGLYGKGDFIGYAIFLEGTYHVETAQVIEDCELVLIPWGKIDSLQNENPRVMKKFMKLLAESLMEKEEQVLGFAYNTLRKKVAEALMSFEKKYHNVENASIVIARDELASIAGTATESLIRTLTEFKQENLIEMNKGIITIINKRRLQNLLR